VGLSEDLERVAATAQTHAEAGEELTAVIPAAPAEGAPVYLCAFANGESRAWLALDGGFRPVRDRRLLRDAVSIAAMCELAEETAGGGDLEELQARLVSLRESENPEGIDEAEEAVAALRTAIGTGPRIATPAYLDEVGGATRRLERALGELAHSPFADAMKSAAPSVEGLVADVEARYKLELN
jgi:hypothetical protein